MKNAFDNFWNLDEQLIHFMRNGFNFGNLDEESNTRLYYYQMLPTEDSFIDFVPRNNSGTLREIWGFVV